MLPVNEDYVLFSGTRLPTRLPYLPIIVQNWGQRGWWNEACLPPWDLESGSKFMICWQGKVPSCLLFLSCRLADQGS
jgi:hypothetical protein